MIDQGPVEIVLFEADDAEEHWSRDDNPDDGADHGVNFGS